MPRIYTRPRGGIHSSGLSFVVGGKLVKFALSAQARGGREGRRGEKRSRGSTCCRVSASPCDLCAVTAPPTCIYAWKLLLHRPNISLLMFHRDALFEGEGNLDLPKHFKSYRSRTAHKREDNPSRMIFMDEHRDSIVLDSSRLYLEMIINISFTKSFSNESCNFLREMDTYFYGSCYPSYSRTTRMCTIIYSVQRISSRVKDTRVNSKYYSDRET